ncbi:MAG: GerMN domain-containing protein [Bacteroides sp.]|nr:GerMN domain-containing protein [Prevotella sp.]MCM1407801.1 GerMN domain-containing protein [Treponema brennaborense]MCM1468851.1 GerMN domain-containing protein [Bacteroides sp.]
MMKNILGTVVSAFNLKGIVCAALLFVCAAVSVVCFVCGGQGTRRIFLFENFDKAGLFIENRFVPAAAGTHPAVPFLRELVLGPVGDRFVRLFPRGTTINTCFVRGQDLYIDLSKDALSSDPRASASRDACEILKKNVFKNFRGITAVHIYIDGKNAYDG